MIDLNSKAIQPRESHLGALLVIALFCCQCVKGSPYRPITAVYVFVQMAAFPALFFLFGHLSRALTRKKEQLAGAVASLSALYIIQKVLIFWVQAALNGNPGFHLMKTSGAPWVYFVLAADLLLVTVIEKKHWNRGIVLILSIAIGCLAGLNELFGDLYCLARLMVFLPFFLMGRWVSWRQLDAIARRIPVKVISLAGFLAVLGSCYWQRKTLYRISAFFAGNKTYETINSDLIQQYGPAVRLAWYVLALVLILAMLALSPNRPIPVVSLRCQQWPLTYLWQHVIAAVFTGMLTASLAERYGSHGYLLALVLGLVLALTTFLPWATRPVEWLMEEISLFFSPGESPQTPLTNKKSTFYQRHKAGIQSTLLFSGAFVLLAVAVMLPFYQSGKSMVWKLDGITQQYTCMAYTSQYLRETIQNFLSTGVLRLNQYTFQSSMGMNIVDVLRKEPFMLLCVFADADHMEGMYAILSILRLYFIGLCFIFFCMELEQKHPVPVTCGALAYTFSGISLSIMVRQTAFQAPCLMYLPLMLAGVERFLRKRKIGLFLGVVCLCFLNGYYLTYLNSLMMGLYLLVRLICLHGKQVKTILSEIFKLIGVYLWGLALSCVLLLPMLSTFLLSSRAGEKGVSVSLFSYDTSYYTALFTGLTKGYPGGNTFWSFVTFAGLTFLAIILLFLKKGKQFLPLKAGIIICTVMICIPLFGKIMNGFGYVINRWVYGFELMAALVLVYLLPEFLHLNKREYRMLLTVSCSYIGLVLLYNSSVQAVRYLGLVLLALSLLAVLAMEFLTLNSRQKEGLLALTMVGTLCLNVYSVFIPKAGNMVADCLNTGDARNNLEGSAAPAVYTIDDDSFYRIDQNSLKVNQSMAMDFYGTSTYFSAPAAWLSEFFLDFQLNTLNKTFSYYGLNGRSALEAISCVKYYLTAGTAAPYGFEKVDEVDGTNIYENQYPLPIGYTYSSYMLESEYDNLNFAEKQQALLQSAVIPDEDAAALSGLEKISPNPTVTEIPCTISSYKGLTIDEESKTIQTNGEEGSITFTFDAPANNEVYFYAEGIAYADSESDDASFIGVSANGSTSLFYLRGVMDTYYVGIDGPTFNMGYSPDGLSECTLIFNDSSTYTYENFRILCLPLDDYVENVTALGAESLENVVENGDTITGTISTSSAKLLTFSVPYSSGWTLTVDGEEVPLIHVDKLYMGALIDGGDHDIQLHYVMPGFRTGAIISGVALAAVVLRGVVILILKKRNS